MRISIKKQVGHNCITREDGEKIFSAIHQEIKQNVSVILDFSGVAVFASPFFNAAIGRLYQDFSSDQIRARLSVEGLNVVGKDVLSRVVENAKKYYSDPKYRRVSDQAINRALND